MTFLWPQYLWLLWALALLPALYLWLLRRRARAAVRYSSLSVVRAAATGRAWRRHVPPALLFLALAMLVLAGTRPLARVPLPGARSTIMLAMDVSLSMRVTDVKPTRLAAAQEAAKAFLKEVPRGIEVGLVTFAGSSHVTRAATHDRDTLAAAIDGFQMQMGTAIGSAIVLCLAELFPDHHIDLSEVNAGNAYYGGFGAFGGGAGASRSQGRSLDDKAAPRPKEITPVAPGSYDAAAIILLSDGRRTTGVDTLAAAKMAADRGVRIHVIGLGTVGGDAATSEGMPIYMQLDEPTLREVARMTGGEYHYAGTAEQLRGVYEKLGSTLEVNKRETELSGLLAMAAALLAVVAAGLSVAWFGRVG